MDENQHNDEMSWEISKENVMPLRTGRNISCLKAALQPSDQDIKDLVAERQCFEEEILAGENTSDPIDSWNRYLSWTQQHFPQGDNTRTYETLLHKYIVKFFKYDQYKNDPRYVNAWLTMAQIEDNAENTFAYMRSEDIGTKCASFYVAWAEEYETYGKYKQAHAVYEMGETNNAQPYEILDKMKKAFEFRAAREIKKKIVEDITDNQVSHSERQEDFVENSSERLTLGTLSGRGKKKLVGTIRHGSSYTGNYPKKANQKNGGSEFHIYHGPDAPLILGKAGKWSEMPDSKKGNKENLVQDPQAWKGSKVKQQSRRTVLTTKQPSPSTFTIYEEKTSEKNLSDAVPFSTRKIEKNVEQILTQRRTHLSQESALHCAIRESYGDKDTNVVRMYPVEKVYSVMGEFQPEEIFAARWRKKRREQEEEERKQSEERRLRALAEKMEREKGIMEEKFLAAEEQRKRKEEQLEQLMQLINSKLLNTNDVKQKDMEKESDSMTVKLENVCQHLCHLTKEQMDDVDMTDNFISNVTDDIKAFPLEEEKIALQKYQAMSTSFDQSRLVQPSPTLCTKTALGEIQDMFLGSFDNHSYSHVSYGKDESIKCEKWKIFCEDELQKHEEKFTIYCDTDDQNLENIPAPDCKQAQKCNDIAGILGPTKSFKIQQDDEHAYQAIDEVLLEKVPSLSEEHEPTFLNDFTITKGQSDEFNDYANTASLPFSGLQSSDCTMRPFDDSLQANFASNKSMSAESTSLWPGVTFCKSNGVVNMERTNENNDENGENKKLSPILETSVEADKSLLASIHQLELNSAPAPTKSFIHPPTVNRKHPGVVSAVQYNADYDGTILEEHSKHNLKYTNEVSDFIQLPPETNLNQFNREHIDSVVNDLCADLMDVSVNNDISENQGLKLEPIPNQNSFDNDLLDTSGSIRSNLINKGNVTSSENFVNKTDVEKPHEMLDLSHELMDSSEISLPLSKPTMLNLIQDPWHDDILKKLMESSPYPLQDVLHINEKMPCVRKGSSVILGNVSFVMENIAGRGAFAKVHLATDSNKKMHALKIQSPAYPWESYALQETKRRLRICNRSQYSEMLMNIINTHVYNDASLIVCDYIENGTLLELIKSCIQERKRLDYTEIAIEIMLLVDALHSVGIIHGDVKPDNLMVAYQKNENVVIPKLKLIDFGRAIDMNSFPPHTAFTRDCGTSGFVCSQMKLKQPWNYHIDFYGIAGTLHVLLLNSYMDTYQDKHGQWKTNKSLPRWCNSTWHEVFTTLLNFPTPSEKWCPTHNDSPLPALISKFRV